MEKEDNYLNEKDFSPGQLGKKNKIRKFLIIGIILVFALIIVFLIYSFFDYTIKKQIGISAEIEKISLRDRYKISCQFQPIV